MRKQNGYTFVELLVVIAVIGVLASVTVFKSPSIVKSRSLVEEASVLAAKISYLITKAKSSQSTIQMVCAGQTVSANIYSGVRSNTLSQDGSSTVSLDAKLRTNGQSHQDQTVFNGSTKILLQCPVACGDVFITSDGYLLTSLNCSSIDFILTNTASIDLSSKLVHSNLGYPRVFAKSSSVSDTWAEVIK